MSPSSRPYKLWPAQLAVFLTCGVLAGLARMPSTSSDEVSRLAAQFHFTPFRLAQPPTPEGGVTYGVNPWAKQLKTYLHPIGGSVALGDIDGDGLSNDSCSTDIRTKALAIAPVPGTGERYAAFELDMDLPVGRENSWPAICKLADMNEDGLMDVYVSMLDGTPLLFLRRDLGDGPNAPMSAASFARQPLVTGPPSSWLSPAATFTDVDGDGHLDLVVGIYFKEGMELYNNNATVPLEMNDSFSRARNGGANRIYLWTAATTGAEPTVTYTEVADPFPGDTEHGWTLAVGAGDIDKDGLSDLYISNDFGPDSLLLNRSTPGKVNLIELKGEETFWTPESLVVGQDSFKGMGIDFADVNGDGLLDMYVSNIASRFALQEVHFVWVSTGDVDAVSRGVAPYEDQAGELGVAHSGWSWDSRMDDFNNDGVLEFVQATGVFKGDTNRWADLAQLGLINDNMVKDPAYWPSIPPGTDVDGWEPNPFFARDSNGLYTDLSAQVFPWVLPNGRAIATADVDGDGDLDMAWGNHWEDSFFYRNDAPNPGAFLGLHLLLPVGATGQATVVHDGHPTWREGTPAVGAFVTVNRPNGPALVRQVDGGNGHTGQRSPDLDLGLGDVAADTALEVAVRWRDRTGALHDETLRLTPGWHTVVLADNSAPAATPATPAPDAETAPAPVGVTP